MYFTPPRHFRGAEKVYGLARHGARLSLSCMLASLFSFFSCQAVFAAMPQTLPVSGSGPDEDRQAAIAALSGSPWPGAIDHLLQKSGGDGKPGVRINYPSLGNAVIDADIRHWVNGLATAFENHLDLQNTVPVIEPENPEELVGPFLQDNDLYSDLSEKPGPEKTFELWGDYSISRPSPSAVSITYELWNYTGNPQGNLDILTLNYNLHNGQRLGLVDIFESPERALELMSEWSRAELEKRLGNMRRPMLELGTEPLVENFSSLTLVPGGIRINFQPLQVAPQEAGIQKVDMPLEALLEAEPLLSLWNR